jgi:CHAT domain-containing protein
VLLGPEAAPATPELPLEPAAAGAAPAQRALRALEAGDAAAARQALDAAGRELNAAAAGPGTLRARLHVGTLRARLSRAPGGTAQDRIRAGETLARAASEAGGDDAASSWAWGLLAELYLDEQRSDEAAVLLRRALLAAQRAPEPAALFRWHARLGRLLRARGDLDAAIAQFRAGLAALAGLRLDASVGRARPELRRDPPLAELVEALLARAAQTEDPAARAAFVRAARDAAEDQGAAEMQDFFADACATARRVAAPDAAPGAVVVHPVLLPDRTELIVSRAAGIESVLVPVPGARVGEEARALRRLLQEPGTRQYLRPAQQLYDWLIRPLQAHLGSAIDTLVLVPLGPLRSLPLAALHDRERGRFLVESYPLAVAPGLGLTEPRAIDPARVRTLKGGLTRAIQGFRPLPHVAEELGAVGERFTGPTLLDTDFRESDLRDALAHQAFGIVHIASHARFGRDASETFLLTWDGRLGAAQLADLVSATDARPEPLELLALSACETALGDERSGLGLAGVAVKAGARSTLATLWSIDDLASSKLVAAFYRELARPGTSRGRALRAAQLELLADPRFAHPAYWAPFLLIGSWL